MKRFLITTAATAALLIAGCSSPVQKASDAGGTLRLSLANGDGAAETLAKQIQDGGNGHVEGVENVWITIKEVQLHTSGGNGHDAGWKTVATPGQKFDFLELVNGLTAPLDLYALPAGHYTQIRLILEEGSEDDNLVNSVIVNGETAPLTIPSAYQTGIKCVRSFFIEEGEGTEICLAFDVLNAIHYSAGNGYMMKPAYRTYKCDGTVDDPDEETSEEETSGGDEEVDWW
ncbi:MAG: DUF4382 domain-containing protein [Chitinispirillaceae bacterium]|nr:DUF4382 domain-containing protein [Chitinispirillaceae bacterium]